MSIASFIEGAISEYNNGRYDVALSLVCSAIDATAKLEKPECETNNKRYKSFLISKMRIITKYGFPGIIANGIKVKSNNLSTNKSDDSYLDIIDVIYEVIRCGLIHECSVEDTVEFVDQTFIGDYNSKFRIPKALLFGLIMAVVVSPSNSNQEFSKTITISANKDAITLDEFWGIGETCI